MAHQSLYRKYRPQTFPDVVGQDHITRTLRNAVEEGAVAHAYLFCGPRGTGKTTTARILAKALDCVNGPTPDPDDTCENCREITEGRHPDVYELDAASRTGVDAVRDEIITKVNYAATRGGWKVYIIDEVHMLSTSAFNALLKTLEEPPARTVFVLCTTHPHKVPETIHSRCQRFDFRRIGVDDIVGRLALIAGKESIAVEEGTLPLIARHALGGMRDAIGTLDQLSAFTGKNVTLPDVEGLLGEVDSARLIRVTDLIADRDAAECFRFVAALVEAGTDVPEFVRGLTQHVRDLYVIAAAGEDAGAVDVTAADMNRLREQSARFDPDRLARMLDVLGGLAGELRWAPDSRLALEVALTRMARPVSDLTLESLAERLATLEAGGSMSGAARSVPATTPVEAAVAPRAREAAPAPRPEPAPTPAAPAIVPAPAPARAPVAGSGPLDVAALRRAWPDVLREMKSGRPMASKAFLETEVDLDGDTVVVEFPSDRRTPMRAADDAETKALLRECIHRVTGADVAVRYQLGRGVVRPDEQGSTSDAIAPPTESAGVQSADAVDVERMLIDSLGAEVIIEHSSEEPGKG
ncbi:MAG: DNA polymerase III subunit gamma/tau [Coriobacteriia bacterium]|nr:DNA polymerase III subunit gamma/tau [Coriobacteriia bacterium]